MDLLLLFQVLLLILFLALAFVGGKLGRSLKQSIVYGSAFLVLSILIALLFTTRIELLIFASLWIIPVGISSNLKVKHQRLSNALLAVGSIWFIALLLFIFIQAPLLFLPTLFILVPLLLVNKFIFTSKKTSTTGLVGRLEKGLESVLPTEIFRKRMNYAAVLPSVIPLIFLLIAFLAGWSLTIQAQTLNSFYSIISQIAGTFLAIVVAVSIFLVSRQEHGGLSTLLVRAVKGLCIIYSLTLIMSLIGLLFTSEVKFQVNLFPVETGAIFYQTIFMVNLGMIFACILYLLITLFEVAEVGHDV